MNENKIPDLIKKIRKDNNLTQNDFANKYNVTYQAVSKWETGKSLPDIDILKRISSDYNVSLDDILEGKYNKRNNLNNTLLIGIIVILLIGIFIYFAFFKDSSFSFKTISSNCTSFTISGSLSYNKSKSAIFINNIDYCGGDDKRFYKNIKCTLYERENSINKVIAEVTDVNKTLEEFLKNVSFTISSYSTMCKSFKDNTLFLEIEATKEDNELVVYKVPLLLNDNCNK